MPPSAFVDFSAVAGDALSATLRHLPRLRALFSLYFMLFFLLFTLLALMPRMFRFSALRR